MAEMGYLVTEGLIEEDLAGRVVDMVVPAEDMGYSHLGIIHDHGEIVSGVAVSSFRSRDRQVLHY